MSSRSIKAGNAYVEIGIRNRLAKGVKGIQSDLKKIGGNVRGIGMGLIGVSGAILAPLVAATQGFAAMGDQVQKMAIRTGIAVKDLSALGFAAEQSGTSLESVGGAIQKMNRRIGRLSVGAGTASQQEAIEKLGLSLEELGKMTPEEQFMALADAMAGYGDMAAAAGLAQRAFGTGVDDLIPLMEGGSAGIRKLKQEAEELGRTMTQEEADSAAAYSDAMNRVQSVIKGLVFQIGGALAPALETAADFIANNTKGFVEFFRANQYVIQSVATVAVGIGTAGAALVATGAAVSMAGVVFGAMATVVGALLSPVALVSAAVVGLGAVLVTQTDLGVKALDFLAGRFGPLVESIKKAGGAILEALKMGDVQAAWELAVTAMQLIWYDLTDEIRESWDGIKTYVLNVGSDIAGGLGQLFQGLADMLDSLVAGYESYYNKVYDTVVEQLGEATGVRTIGAPSGNAFESDFGGAKSGLKNSINNIREFGSAMEQTADAEKDARNERFEQRKAQRDRRLSELRGSIEAQAMTINATYDQFEESQEKSKTDDEEKPGKRRETEIQEATDQAKAGPTGTFNAYAAGIVGMGPQSMEKKQLDETKKTNEILMKIAKKDGGGGKFK
jgi:hypothetical protein